MIEFRRMKKEDAAQTAEIEQAVFSMPWSEKGFLEALDRPEAHFIVASEENKILGYCGIYVAADEGEITNVAVHPAHRRKGIADHIIAKVKEEVLPMGVTQIFLEVRISNQPAIGLYEKHGFQTVGVRKGFYELPKEDANVMRFQIV